MWSNLSEFRKLPPPHELLKNSSWLETKSFWNTEEDEKNIRMNLKIHFPDLKWEEFEKHVEFVLSRIYGNLESKLKNPNTFVHLDKPLPKWTKWSDIIIYITWLHFDWENSWILKDCEVDIYLKDSSWKEWLIKKTNFHEMLLENTVKNRVSLSGLLLLLVATGKEFSWSTETIPRNYRVAKTRLSKDLKNFFWLNSDPIFRDKWSNMYDFKLKITANSVTKNSCSWLLIDSVLKELYEKS